MPMKYRDLIKLIEADGWYWVGTKEAIRSIGTRRKRVQSSSRPTDLEHVKVGLGKAILKQAGVK